MNLFTFENITLLIALWGAVLSTVKVLFDYSKKRWNLKVDIGYTLDNSIFVSAKNIGYENVTFSMAGFILPNGKLFWNPLDVQKYQVPYTLLVGKSIGMPQGSLKELAIELKHNGYSGKIKLKGFYKTDIGKIFKSKSFDFDIEKVLAKTE
jgi:hypothetical protein